MRMIVEMPKSELVSLWSKTQDSTFPANRSENSPLDAFYPITDYFVKIVDEKPVAGVGFSKGATFTFYGGAFSTQRGAFSELDKHFLANTSGPYIVGLSSNNIDNKAWIESFRKKGWDIAPSNLGRYEDDPTIQAFRDYYTNHPRGATWAVKDLPIAKWFEILR